MNLLLAFRSVIQNSSKTAELALLLAIRNFRTRYVGSKAGYFWVILSPLLYGGVFIVLRDQLSKQGAYVNTNGINPIVFAFFGVIVYQVWIEAVLNQCNYLRNASSMMRNMLIPPEIFALSSLILSTFELFVRIIILTIFILLMRVEISVYAPFGLLAMLGAVVTGNAIGYILALPASFFSDISRFIQSISLGILLASPIFYAATTDTESIFYWIQLFNPLAVTLTVSRALVFGSELLFLNAALAWFAILSLICVFMTCVYRIVTPIVMERL